MSDYIKREDAIGMFDNSNGIVYPQEVIQKAINAIPAADVVEVVRCKDCVRKEDIDEETKAMFPGEPEFYCHHIDCPVNGNGFCSSGKRKDGDAHD